MAVTALLVTPLLTQADAKQRKKHYTPLSQRVEQLFSPRADQPRKPRSKHRLKPRAKRHIHAEPVRSKTHAGVQSPRLPMSRPAIACDTPVPEPRPADAPKTDAATD